MSLSDYEIAEALAAVAASGADEHRLRFWAQLLGAEACPTCDYRKRGCACTLAKHAQYWSEYMEGIAR